MKILSDGGPCFRTAFRDWGRQKGINIGITATYSSSSNGAAENAVKQAKGLWQKTKPSEFKAALANMNAQNRADGGMSPSALFHGRELRVSGIPSLLTMVDLSKAREQREETRKKSLERILGIKMRSPIAPGAEVILKDMPRGSFRERGTIIEQRKDGVSYLINTPHGVKI